jgi:uncharacterized protein YabE (DUF348 family)
MAQGTDGDLASSNEAFDSHQESSQAVHDRAAVHEHDQALPPVDSMTSVSPVPVVEAPVTAVVPAAATTSRTHRFRKPALVGAAALVCALTVGGGTVAALTKTVTISVDGRTQQVTTLAGSVDGALAAAGLRVDSHDTLAPAGAVGISDGSRIALNRGREFTVRIDGKQQTIWTTARTVDDALTEIGRRAEDFQLSADRSRAIPLDGLQVTAASLHTVSVSGSQGKITRVTSPARTVGDLLQQQGVILGRNDRVSPALSSMLTDGTVVTVRTLPTVVVADGSGKAAQKVSDLKTVGDLLKAQNIKVGKDDVVTPSVGTMLRQGLRITITRVGYRLVTKTQVVVQPADQSVQDASMDQGTSSVAQQGQAGAIQVTYRMKIVNGKPGAPVELGRRTVKPAVATINHVGTYVAPVVVHTSTPTVVQTSAPSIIGTSTATSTGTTSDPTPTQQTTAAAPTTSTRVLSRSRTSSDSDTPTSSSAPKSAPAAGGAGYYDDSSHWSVNWDAIAHCESTNNWSINTGNGYYGGLQFDYTTWLGAGGGAYADRADHASKSQQIAIAEKVYAARGLGPWACGYAAG